MMTVENQVNEQLWVAAACGDVEAVKAALAAGADVNTSDNEGDTPLKAVGDSDAAVRKMLRDAGAR